MQAVLASAAQPALAGKYAISCKCRCCLVYAPASALQQNKYLLATCYRHCNQGYRAVHLLQGSNSQHCRYLAALCCLDLRQYKDAEQLLLQQGESQVRTCTWLQQYVLQEQRCSDGVACGRAMLRQQDQYTLRACALRPLS